MNIERYLRRIDYQGQVDTTAETLRNLHERHLFTVPFENLDIGRRPIVIDEAAFVRKVVEERRGGFCYELNGAFSALLRSLGFDVMLLSAGVARQAGGFGPEFDHLALLVSANGERWLADVGFGDSFVRPLRFVTDTDLQDPAGAFRIERDADSFIVRWAGKPQYRFLLIPHALDEYAPRCHFHQTSPESSFTQKSVCSLATPVGRITLSDRRLITTESGERTERELSEAEWTNVLRDVFGVTLPRGA
ncbi:MAG TPA: arylamine N-acetyltransferase [Thermoanaerobaculia bacterium]|nr:arylamine N-acetyltransferase [Thermoanaerobaculia bacterium]